MTKTPPWLRLVDRILWIAAAIMVVCLLLFGLLVCHGCESLGRSLRDRAPDSPTSTPPPPDPPPSTKEPAEAPLEALDQTAAANAADAQELATAATGAAKALPQVAATPNVPPDALRDVRHSVETAAAAAPRIAQRSTQQRQAVGQARQEIAAATAARNQERQDAATARADRYGQAAASRWGKWAVVASTLVIGLSLAARFYVPFVARPLAAGAAGLFLSGFLALGWAAWAERLMHAAGWVIAALLAAIGISLALAVWQWWRARGQARTVALLEAVADHMARFDVDQRHGNREQAKAAASARQPPPIAAEIARRKLLAEVHRVEEPA